MLSSSESDTSARLIRAIPSLASTDRDAPAASGLPRDVLFATSARAIGDGHSGSVLRVRLPDVRHPTQCIPCLCMLNEPTHVDL